MTNSLAKSARWNGRVSIGIIALPFASIPIVNIFASRADGEGYPPLTATLLSLVVYVFAAILSVSSILNARLVWIRGQERNTTTAALRQLLVIQIALGGAILGWLTGLSMTFTRLNTLSFWIAIVSAAAIASLAVVVTVLALSTSDQKA